MTPCGKCLNCRNGYAGMCVRNAPTRKAAPKARKANECNDCERPIPAGMRVCTTCRRLHRKATYRRVNRKRQIGQVQATTVKAFSAL